MTVEYSLTRSEIVRSFFEGLRSSPKFMAVILLYALGLAVFTLTFSGAFSRPFSIRDIGLTVVTTACFLLLLPLILFARAKTATRTLSISPEGISTQIGKMQGQIPWRKIKVVSLMNNSVLVARTNGNAFFIPNRAFTSPEHRIEFAEKINARIALTGDES